MTIGQAVGGIAGGVIGTIVSPGAGTMIGFQIGMMIGGLIDPPKPPETPTPQAQDLQFNTWGRNLPVPVCYGLVKTSGNMLWYGNTRSEIVERDVQGAGKGGPEPPKQKEIWYFADFAIGLSEGEIASVEQVFLDEEDISAQEGLTYTTYLGTATQAADATVVTALGAEAPAFRNTAYLKLGGRLGQVNRLPIVSSVFFGITPQRPLAGTNILGTVTVFLYADYTVATVSHLRRLVKWPDGTYWMGVHVTITSDPTQLLRSTDGGATWTDVFALSSTVINPLNADLLLHPTSDRLYASVGNINESGGAGAHFNYYNRSGGTYTTSGGTDCNTGITLGAESVWTLTREPTSGRLWAAATIVLTTAGTPPRRFVTRYSDDDGATWLPTNDYVELGNGLGYAWGAPRNTYAPRAFYHNNRVYVMWTETNAQEVVNGPLKVRSHAVGDDPATWDAAVTIYSSVNQWAYDVVKISTGFFCFVYDASILCRVYKLSGTNTWTLVYTDSSQVVGNISGIGYCVIQDEIYEIFGTAFSTNDGYTNVRWRRFNGVRFSAAVSTPEAVQKAYHSGILSFHSDPVPTVEYAVVGTDTAGKWGSTSQDVWKVYYAKPTGSVTYPRNPVMAVRDLLLAPRYGLGLPADRLHETSFTEAAAFCDELVTNPDGSQEERFMGDFVLDTQRPVLDHLRDMLATFRGYLVWSQGQVKCFVERAASGTVSLFDMDSIVADSFSWRKQGYRDRPNVVRVDYINGADDYRHDFAEAFDDWDIDETGERRERAMQLLGITRSTQAQRMAQFFLDQAIHIQHACSFRVGIGAASLEVGSIIAVSHDVPGWVEKFFRIIQIEEAENDELSLNCIEYNADIYHDYASAAQVSVARAVNPYELPYQVIRLSAYKRPLENLVEVSYTRATSGDFFAGAMLYSKRGAGQYDPVGTTLGLGPTAYLDNQAHSLTLVTSGAAWTGFADRFDRTDSGSLGADWNEILQTGWEVYSGAVRRGAPGSVASGDGVLATSGHFATGDVLAEATLVTASGQSPYPRVGLLGRFQRDTNAGSVGGQGYVYEYASRTMSHAVTGVALWRVTSGPTWTLLGSASVASGTYWTTQASPAWWRLDITSYGLTGRLNDAAAVTATDSWIQGSGEGGFARRGGEGISWTEQVSAAGPLAWWRFGEALATLPASEQTGRVPGSYYPGATQGVPGGVAGDGDTAVQFNGTSGQMRTIASSLLTIGSADFTMELLLKSTTNTFGAVWTIRAPDATETSILAYMSWNRNNSADGRLWWESWAWRDADTRLRSQVGLNDGAYHHVMVVSEVQSSLARLFVDGTLVDSRTQIASGAAIDTQSLYMAAFGNNVAFNQFAAVTIDEAAVYSGAVSSASILDRAQAIVEGRQKSGGETWDNFSWGQSSFAPITVQGVSAGWSTRLFSADSQALASAVGVAGTATLSLGGSPAHAASAFLQVYTNGTSYTGLAPQGQFPQTGAAAVRPGDIYRYVHLEGIVTAVQTTLPLFHARGGFANVGSLRLRAEQLGYATFTDSQCTGVTRGTGGTTATSHSNFLALGACVIESGGVGSAGLITATAAATDPASNLQLFSAQSMRVFLGASSKTARLWAYLATHASSPLGLGYDYSTGDGTWTSLTASGFLPPVDQTSGFTRSGPIYVEPPGNWSPTMRVASGGATLADGTSRYYLALTRTSPVSLATLPVEHQFLLDGDLVIAGRTSGMHLFEPTLADSGQVLTFKAIAVGVRGQMADGTQAPTTGVWSG